MKLKMQRRAAWARKHMPKRESICVNCGQPGAHFAPPSMGEPSFFTCAIREEMLHAEVFDPAVSDLDYLCSRQRALGLPESP